MQSTIDMNQHSIQNVKSPVNKLDAVNKAYVDRIKYKSATGTIRWGLGLEDMNNIFLAIQLK